jgi:oligosaccharide repeat unit polymerase
MTKLLANPFFVYILSFALALLVYSFGWSHLYPNLSTSLLVFFFATFIVSFLFGVIVHSLGRIDYKVIKWNEKTTLYLILIWVGYVLEFIYNGGIPILISGANREQFGIPVFHVFLVTFSSFYSVYLFHQLCSDFKKSRLLLFLLSILPAVLIGNRGMLMMNLTSCLFVYLLSLRTVRLKVVLGITFLVLVIFYLFGVMGNIRQLNTTSSDYILGTSQASESFKNSIIPKEYIWTYLYISSPLANLQQTMYHSPPQNDSWAAFLNYELFPDFISKRTAALLGIEDQKKDVPRIAPWLTVSTWYARSYVYLGWLGIIILFLFFVATTFLYLFALRKSSDYYVVGIAILSTLALYNTFDNMYAFTGLNFQLIYPLLLGYIRIPKITLNLRRSSI